MITQAALDEVYAYRAHVDQAFASLLGLRPTRQVAELIELGCYHEQQHQELLLDGHPPPVRAKSDLTGLPRPCPGVGRDRGPSCALLHRFRGGIVEIGHGAVGFAFDSERPRHLAC